MSIKERREQVGISQEELAYKVGVSYATYRRWETGGQPKQWSQLLKLAALLKCKPEDLVR